MTERGRTIKLYIRGSEYKNLKEAELSNWIGKAYIGKRKHVGLLQKIDELSSPGVYILLQNLEQNLTKKIYIGEADEVNSRLLNHHGKKDWWEDFVIFISKDTNLTKAHVRWLEKNLYHIALKNPTTIELDNNAKPGGSKLSASDIDDMEQFLENIVFVLDNLGIIDFTKTSEQETSQPEDNVIFLLNISKDRVDSNGLVAQARMTITRNGYRLLKGSYIEKETRKSFVVHTYYSLRQKFDNNKYLDNSDIEGCFFLKQDIDFPSSSAAAAVAKNRATNGPKEWKLPDGTTLDDYENEINI